MAGLLGESSLGSYDECKLSATRPTTLRPSQLLYRQLPSLHPSSSLLSPKADTHFSIPQRVEGWVDLSLVTHLGGLPDAERRRRSPIPVQTRRATTLIKTNQPSPYSPTARGTLAAWNLLLFVRWFKFSFRRRMVMWGCVPFSAAGVNSRTEVYFFRYASYTTKGRLS